MMTKFITAIATFLCLACIGQNPNKTLIPDGLYLIVRVDTVETSLNNLPSYERPIFFNKQFDDFNSEEYLRLIVNTTEYVPLELEKKPNIEPQTENKKKLLLTLTKTASDSLKSFTTKHLQKHVALIIDGEALTMHKIKEPLTSGQLQITRCNDNACELLYSTLNDNVKLGNK